jgi:hypothetical protein
LLEFFLALLVEDFDFDFLTVDFFAAFFVFFAPFFADVFFFVAFFTLFLAPAFFGTFFPSARASDNPIAIACLRLLTVFPEPPLFSVPALRFFIARSTVADAFFEYFAIQKSSLLAQINYVHR